ncbi:MAG: hypothetical protein U0169_04015 [Polyangiaceae bacterium]
MMIRKMVTGALVFAMAATTVGCSRNNIEAVNLANEGDNSGDQAATAAARPAELCASSAPRLRRRTRQETRAAASRPAAHRRDHVTASAT